MNLQALGANPSHIRERVGWRRLAGYGVPFGIIATALESFALPLADIAGEDLLLFEWRVLLVWSITGMVLAKAMTLFGRRLVPMWIAVGITAFAMPVIQLSGLRMQIYMSDSSVLNTDMSYLHVWWGGLMYSGLFVLAYRLSVRSERTRRLLAAAEIAREQAEAAWAAARLQVLQGQVDPAFLLRVMIEVQRRYAHDADGVDRLLDTLVGFLRAAMPGVRSGGSTLAAEILLARQYAGVRAELEPGRLGWRIEVEGSLPDIPFPALLLLPVLDQFAAAQGPEQHSRLQIQCDDRRCTLCLSSPAPTAGRWLAADLQYRLRVGLSAAFDTDWELALGDDLAVPPFVLRLPLVRPVRAKISSLPDKETTHG